MLSLEIGMEISKDFIWIIVFAIVAISFAAGQYILNHDTDDDEDETSTGNIPNYECDIKYIQCEFCGEYVESDKFVCPYCSHNVHFWSFYGPGGVLEGAIIDWGNKEPEKSRPSVWDDEAWK